MKRLAICALAGILPVLCVSTFKDAEAAGPATCIVRLPVELSPDVPNPSGPGLVSSLLGNHVGDRLTLMRQVGDTSIDAQLDGPGAGESCEEVVESMRGDGRAAVIDEQGSR
jgi:hypothetical protein